MRQGKAVTRSFSGPAWAVTALCLVGVLYLSAMQGMLDLGAAAHDAYCPEHGWAVAGR